MSEQTCIYWVIVTEKKMETELKAIWIIPKDNPTALVNPATRERIAFYGQEDCLKALKLLHETALPQRQTQPE